MDALQVEVTRGRGLGFVGAAFATPDSLREELAYARKSFPDLGNEPLPIGLGYIGWILDANEEQSEELIYVRASSANARATHKPLIFLQATSLEEALVAANEWKVDVIIAQGNEAGGHGGKSAPSTMVMLSEILAALPAENAPPVLPADGISNGSQAAAYLVAGAAGVVLGTRFTLTTESAYPEYNKAAIQRAKSTDTVRTHALDWAWNLYSWPEGIDGRGIRTKIVDDIDAGVPHEVVRARYAKAAEEHGPGYMVTWCNQGVSLMEDVKPVKKLVEEPHADIVRSLQRGQRLLA
ncbi:hypothetical protein BN946_scf184533.g2 [Trametes cinnabarina]|uniref:Uncharacterized protein n=1 Tax=Pycnoporus cinnabarinus TaxID=5643 RepID=A0A060SN01_PYCCI|nr:hypothetical protein BN946_scf184533.g2 [Trametes cinnabarina]